LFTFTHILFFLLHSLISDPLFYLHFVCFAGFWPRPLSTTACSQPGAASSASQSSRSHLLQCPPSRHRISCLDSRLPPSLSYPIFRRRNEIGRYDVFHPFPLVEFLDGVLATSSTVSNAELHDNRISIPTTNRYLDLPCFIESLALPW
jgi:hypothetical protein